MDQVKFTRSSKSNPCPVCNRTKDADCSIGPNLVLCHSNTGHTPGKYIQNGWAFTKDASDGRCGVFVPHKPQKTQQSDWKQKEQIYEYSSTQRSRRYYKAGKKQFCPQHKVDGQWKNGAGPGHWPLYRQDKVSASHRIFEFEGEKCADIGAEGGLAAVSHPGHAHSKKEDRLKRYQDLKNKGIKEILIVADNDAHGMKRAAASGDSARRSGLWVQVIKAVSVWPSIPEGGSIDDAPGSPIERANALQKACREQDPYDVWGELKPEYYNSTDDDDNQDAYSYSKLIDALLDETVLDRPDQAMPLRAELINRFRVTGSQVEQALFKRQMQREAGGKSKAPPQSLDLSAITGMDYLLDGFIIENDQVMLWGGAGTGKTTVGIGIADSHINGKAFLDHSNPAKRGAVLFIASDSGPAPLKATIQDFGLDQTPAFNEGPDKRFHVWASDQNQGMNAWSADLQGCMRLLHFVKEFGISLVIIDSCKAVLAGTDIEYTDNRGVTALMTFFKEVICPHTTVVWLNHDGAVSRGPGCPAGAKAWKEIPSIVHHLTVPIDPETKKPVKNHRQWLVEKNRLGITREFLYSFADGELAVLHGQTTHGNCLIELVEFMSEGFLRNEQRFWKTRDLYEACKQHSAKTVANTLTTATKAKHPEICRKGRGTYALAPRILETLIKARSQSGGSSSNPSPEQASSDFPSTSQPPESGSSPDCTVLPNRDRREDVGKKVNPCHANESDRTSSQAGPHVKAPKADEWGGFAAAKEVS